jgi:hypothetical protein
MSVQDWHSPQNIPPRQFERYTNYHDLAVSYEGYAENIPVRVPDISPRGMFINTATDFPEGAVLNVSFRLTKSNFEVSTRAEVRYCLPGVGIGVEFIAITPEAEKAIEEELRIGRLVPRDS